MTRLGAADFGIIGDGATDSTDGFLALHVHLLSDRERVWEVEFPPGHYLTRAPHWLSGVGRVRLMGYGATLQQANLNQGLFSDSEPFRTLTYDDANPDDDPVRTHHPGYKIVSVEVGSSAVVCPGGTAGITAGAIALLGGYVQQTANNHLPPAERVASGWPPNLRYFEYVTVLAVDGDTVQLARPLRFSYDEGWRDYPGNHFGPYMAGAPRLYLCDRADWNIPLSIEMHGFTFLRARHSTTGGHIGFKPAMRLHLEDCVVEPGGFVQMNDRLTMVRCNYGDQLEVDKCIRSISLDDCDFGGPIFSRGAGCLEFSIRNSRVVGDLAINPRVSTVVENVACFRNFALAAQHGGYYDTEPFTITVQSTRP